LEKSPPASQPDPARPHAGRLRVVALAGGVGGARLAEGLAQALPPENLTVVVNTGDDFEHLGLYICPDLDTVCYTLAGISNPATGWGRSGETWQALESLAALGGPTWFRLGDADIGLHLERTRRLRSGQPLSAVTLHFCRSLGVPVKVLPATDDATPTWVYTLEGELPFQEYFVRRQCQPHVTGFRFEGAETARPAPGVLQALADADLVVVCPSNPWVSIDPMLAVPGIRTALQAKPAVAVSPIIGGQTVKGPAAKMFAELGIVPSALSVAQHYRGWVRGLVIDRIDETLAAPIQDLGIRVLVTDTIMKSTFDRARLAKEVIDFGLRILR
jgi:LPPG:FO 2-phospho-L-lactate transferase